MLKEEHLFEIEIVCEIINVFSATFDQFNASLLNKTNTFFPKNKCECLIYIGNTGYFSIIQTLFWFGCSRAVQFVLINPGRELAFQVMRSLKTL